MKLPVSIAFVALPASVWGAPAPRGLSPTVVIPSPAATIVGSPGLGVESFNGIPFAQPPTGSLRLRPPQPIQTPMGTIQAVGPAKSCPQFEFSTDPNNIIDSLIGRTLDIPLFQEVTDSGEDCLTISIRRPSGTTAASKLPVLYWIYGGGFEFGATSQYEATPLVLDAIATGMPIIFVAVNYRLGGFGFMPGKEVLADGASNLGLLDQRLGLQWVADNIEAFGGDPTKVTIWGESAGSISVMDQMALYDGNNTYKGKPLFRGAIMDSGSIVPADPVDCPKGQVVYDTVVQNAGCSGASDTLECLRSLDYTTFLNAANSVPSILSYNSVALSYLPRPDGTVLTDSPDRLVLAGKYAPVPFIVGDQEDEGTIFSIFQNNITTIDELATYFKDLYFHDATMQQIYDLIAQYPNISTDGSPFRTGYLNNWYPQYKRLAAMLGDLAFTLARRGFLNGTSTVNPNVPSWSYLSSYDYGTPIIGTFHASDILQVFYGILPDYASAAIRSYYFSFVHHLDPNAASNFMYWPQWSQGHNLMNFYNVGAQLLQDNFRWGAYEYTFANVDSFHV